MSTITVGSKEIEVDEEGYLINLGDWDKDVAVVLAESERSNGMEDLTDAHWEILDFLREYYEEFQIAPAVRVLTKAVGKKLGKDKGNSQYLYSLFPQGPGKQACKIAGLPKPTGCI
jgi:tRNA 2-thiouridine synthesizing protein E